MDEAPISFRFLPSPKFDKGDQKTFLDTQSPYLGPVIALSTSIMYCNNKNHIFTGKNDKI